MRFRDDDASDLAGDGVAGGRMSNFVAGLAEFDGVDMGLSRGETNDTCAFVTVLGLDDVPLAGFCNNGIDDIGDGFIFKPDGSFNCS